MLATPGERITTEFVSAPKLNRLCAVGTDGRWDFAAADAACQGVSVEIVKSDAAPYVVVIQVSGVAQVESDGAATIAAADLIAAGASGGQCKTRARADGTTVRHFIGRALDAAAATQALLVDILIQPFSAGNT